MAQRLSTIVGGGVLLDQIELALQLTLQLISHLPMSSVVAILVALCGQGLWQIQARLLSTGLLEISKG